MKMWCSENVAFVCSKTKIQTLPVGSLDACDVTEFI